MFNALRYIKSLEDVGFPREQAEAQVQLVIDSFQENVATRSDLAEVKSELKAEMADLKAELKAEMADLKAELKAEMADLKAELKTDMVNLRGDFARLAVSVAEMKTDLIFKLGGLMALCTGILGFLIKT